MINLAYQIKQHQRKIPSGLNEKFNLTVYFHITEGAKKTKKKTIKPNQTNFPQKILYFHQYFTELSEYCDSKTSKLCIMSTEKHTSQINTSTQLTSLY